MVCVWRNTMKNYDEVVRDRYDKENYKESLLKNVYSYINDVGYYGARELSNLLRKYIKLLLASNKEIDDIKILDVGCGNGYVTRCLCEILGNPKQIYGFDYSKSRVANCQKMNPNINYKFGNVVEEFAYEEKFDGITTFDVFMHLKEEKDILNGLRNVRNSLKEDGIFLWYEVNATSHFANIENQSDGEGYSKVEMDSYANQVGLQPIFGGGIYRNYPIIGSSYYYMSNKTHYILQILDMLPFFPRTINYRFYKKV